MTFGAIAGAAVSVVGGALLSSGSSSSASAAADPFASQRPQYQAQLQSLMANPSSVTSTPGYQFQLQQGLQATQATNAARGLGSSGMNDAAQTQYAEGLASSTYQQDFNNLALLSGATTGSPAAASQAITAGNASAAAGLGTIAGGIGKAVTAYNNQPAATTDTSLTYA